MRANGLRRWTPAQVRTLAMHPELRSAGGPGRRRGGDAMVRAACHCTAVRFEIDEHPGWVLDCNCTICRRYGALWTYFRGPDQAKLLTRPAPDATEAYLWGERSIGFQRCKTCGCVTHLQAADTATPVIF